MSKKEKDYAIKTPYVTIIKDFIKLENSFPPRYTTDENLPAVRTWLLHIKYAGFSLKIMKNIIQYIYTLQRRGKYAEATQLLLISAATKNNLANYIFAKELFLGILFEKNEATSFAIFSQLAQEEFPEAIYNIGYFYQHGIVVPKNKKQAKIYYKKANTLGTNYTFIDDYTA